jgi:hypothetical protein
MRWIDWAFQAKVPTAEKLVLVYLATRANYAGVGLMDREELQRLTDYERRSVQRLLKALRDAKLLADGGPWYILTPPETEQGLPPATIDALPPPQEGGPVSPAVGPLLASGEADAVAERIGAAIQDGAEFLVDQMSNAEARLAQLFVRGAQQLEVVLASVQTHYVPPAPPPDPVKESPRYVQLLDLGIAEDLAYSTVKAMLEREGQAKDAEAFQGAAREAAGQKVSTPKRDAYSDDVSGRFMRVWDILHDKPPTEAVLLELGAHWSLLEAEENKHSVKGESVTAFEQLYPAIVRTAHEQAGKMTMRQFLDGRAIAEGRAPWDRDPSPTLAEDATLEAEIATMLRELTAVNDPRCRVGPRTTERGDDGVKRTETIVGYHRRVSAKYREMLKLKDMGAFSG